MQLSLLDRMLILNTVLPKYSSRKGTELKMAIEKKIAIPSDEQKYIVAKELGNGQMEIGIKPDGFGLPEKEFQFPPEELQFLKEQVALLDQNGMFSADTLHTYSKIEAEV